MGEITIRQAQVKKRPRRETKICCGAPRDQRGATNLKWTLQSLGSPNMAKTTNTRFQILCESFWNVVPAAGIERYTTTDNTQLIEKARRSKRNNRPMPHSDVQNHVQPKSGAAALLEDQFLPACLGSSPQGRGTSGMSRV